MAQGVVEVQLWPGTGKVRLGSTVVGTGGEVAELLLLLPIDAMVVEGAAGDT